jgi:hypothetical protein
MIQIKNIILLTFIIISITIIITIDHHHHVEFTSGPIGTVSPLHYDCYYNLLAQTVGKINYSTKLSKDVYVYHYDDKSNSDDDNDDDDIYIISSSSLDFTRMLY